MKRLRHSGAKFRFFCAFELQPKSQRPHAHAVVFELTPISERQFRLAFGQIGFTHAKLVKNPRAAAGYAVKYASKAAWHTRVRASIRFGRKDGDVPTLSKPSENVNALGSTNDANSDRDPSFENLVR